MRMSILKVARLGHPALRAPARALGREELRSAPVQRLIDDLIETMREYHGIGLAATQVHEGVCIFVAAISPDDEEPLPDEAEPMVFVNPVVTPVGADSVEEWEGCLSVPDMRGRVVRAREIDVTFMDRYGERLSARAHGHPARVIQHETDHLNGLLFIDRMTGLQSLTYLDEYARYWVKERDPED
jgi:peptide deformylase